MKKTEILSVLLPVFFVSCGTFTSVDGSDKKNNQDAVVKDSSVVIEGADLQKLVQENTEKGTFSVEVSSSTQFNITVNKNIDGTLKLTGNGTVVLKGNGNYTLLLNNGNVNIKHEGKGAVNITAQSSKPVKVNLNGEGGLYTYNEKESSKNVDFLFNLEGQEAPVELPVEAPTEPENTGYNLSINLSGIKKVKGQVCYSMFNEANKDSFADSNADPSTIYKADCIEVQSDTMVINIPSVKAGVYALAVFHDADKNGKLNTAPPFGIPTERFAFSSEPNLGVGAPKFEECQFTVASDISMDIKLISLLGG